MRNATLLLFVGLCGTANAQWTTDAADPMVLCNAPNDQTGLKAISDGADGWYAFWCDQRADGTHGELYGQHLDAGGHALWLANGQLFQGVLDSSITEVAPALMADGTVLVAYLYQGLSGSDGVIKAFHLSPAGAPLGTVIELARSGAGPLGNILSLSSVKAMTGGGGAYVAWSCIPEGSNGRYGYEHIALDGTVQFGSPGHMVPDAGFGPFNIHDDHNGGILFIWRANNTPGTSLLATRMGADGNPAWETVWGPGTYTWVSVNSQGLDLDFDTAADEYGFYAAYMSAGNIRISKFSWSGYNWIVVPTYACNNPYTQEKPRIAVSDGYIYAGWSDNRPPANTADMYVQQTDAWGNAQWTINGVAAIQTPSTNPTTGLVPSYLSTIATFVGTESGFCATRLHFDATHIWPTPTSFCTPAFNPLPEQQVVLPDGHAGVVAFWQTAGTDLYAGRIYASGSLGDHIGMDETGLASNDLGIFPIPASNSMTLTLAANEHANSVRAIDAQGRTIALQLDNTGDRPTINVGALAAGTYALEVVTGEGVRNGRFIIAR